MTSTTLQQPVNVCRRYASAYQLACDVSDNKASVNSELDGTFYEGYVHQVYICERLIAFFVLWLDEKSQASLFFKSIGGKLRV